MLLDHPLLSIYITVLVGVVAGKAQLFNQEQIEGFEVFLFKIGIPCYLFNVILTSDFAVLMNVQYIASYLLSFAIVASITAIYFLRSDSFSDVCIKILASGYVNAAIYTLPVVTFLLGDPKAAILGNLVQVSIIQPVFLVILSFLKHREKSIPHKLLQCFSNPVVVAPIVAIMLSYYHVELTPTVMNVTKYLGGSVGGIALFTFGLSFSSIKVTDLKLNRQVAVISIIKTVLHPMAAFIVGHYLFHLDRYWLSALLIASTAPTAFIVYIIAKQFSGHMAFVRTVIFFSSVLSLISLAIISQVISQ